MHRLGRDGIHLEPEYPPGSILMFCFGSIDIDTKLGKQVQKGRISEEVITDLTDQYIEMLIAAIRDFRDRYFVAIMGPLPPSSNPDSATGSDLEKLTWTNQMDQMLQAKCSQHGFYFFDMYSNHHNSSGMLEGSMTDGNHILNSPYVVERLWAMASEALKLQNFGLT